MEETTPQRMDSRDFLPSRRRLSSARAPKEVLPPRLSKPGLRLVQETKLPSGSIGLTPSGTAKEPPTQTRGGAAEARMPKARGMREERAKERMMGSEWTQRRARAGAEGEERSSKGMLEKRYAG